MSDLAWRIIILGALALVVAVAVWRSTPRAKAKLSEVSRPDLGPGVYFFSSDTCAPCHDTRRVLHSAYGDAVIEIRFDDDPSGFAQYGVSSVPTVFVLGSDGSGTRLEGVPSRRQLQPLDWRRP
jgi:hypothetical protein